MRCTSSATPITPTDEPVEIINLRLVARGRRAEAGDAAAAARGPRQRRASSARSGSTRAARSIARSIDRDELPAGAKLEGPALVSEYGSTTVIFPGDRLAVAETGELIISVESE